MTIRLLGSLQQLPEPMLTKIYEATWHQLVEIARYSPFHMYKKGLCPFQYKDSIPNIWILLYILDSSETIQSLSWQFPYQ